MECIILLLCVIFIKNILINYDMLFIDQWNKTHAKNFEREKLYSGRIVKFTSLKPMHSLSNGWGRNKFFSIIESKNDQDNIFYSKIKRSKNDYIGRNITFYKNDNREGDLRNAYEFPYLDLGGKLLLYFFPIIEILLFFYII